MHLNSGDKAPVFKALSHNGEEISLENYRGNIVVLYFYPRAMTPGCSREALRFNGLAEEFERCGAVIMGVSTDPPGRNKRFADKIDVTRIMFLSDPDGSVTREYGVLKKVLRDLVPVE